MIKKGDEPDDGSGGSSSESDNRSRGGSASGSRSSSPSSDEPPPRFPAGWRARAATSVAGALAYATTGRMPRAAGPTNPAPADPPIPDHVGIWDTRRGEWDRPPTSWGAVTSDSAWGLHKLCGCGVELMFQTHWNNRHDNNERTGWVGTAIDPLHAPADYHLCQGDGWKWRHKSRRCGCRTAAASAAGAAAAAAAIADPGTPALWAHLAQRVALLPDPKPSIPKAARAAATHAAAAALACPLPEAATRAYTGVVLAARDVLAAAIAFTADPSGTTQKALDAIAPAAPPLPPTLRPPGDPMRGARASLRQGMLSAAMGKVEAADADPRPPPDRGALEEVFRTDGSAPDLTAATPPTPVATEEPDRSELAAARAALRGVKACSAAGPDRLSGRHLHSLVRCGDPAAVEALCLAFARYARAYNAGVRPSDDPAIRSQLLAVRLHPVPKGRQGWRPVVIPNVFSRTAGRALVRGATRTAAPELLSADQYAVGIASGAEIMVRAVREAIRDGHAVAVLDRRNADGSADREALVKGLKEMGGEDAAAAAAARYSDGIPIVGLDIEATQGAVQGDPLSPILFGSMQAAQTRRLGAALPDIFAVDSCARVLSFLDDVVLIAPTREELVRVVDALIADDATLGLSLNESKCAANVDIRGWRNFTADGGVVVLGIAVGTDAFVRQHAASALAKAANIETRIVAADLPLHDKYMLLTKCGAHSRLVHTLRSTPPRLTAEMARDADAGTRAALAKLLQAGPEEVPQWAFLPARVGGLGLATMASTAAPAYIAGTIASLAGHPVRDVTPPTAPPSECRSCAAGCGEKRHTGCQRSRCVTCCAATSALDHQRCDHCATLCERAGRAAEWPRDEPDFDAAVTEWRAAAEIGEETARGVIALAARTQRPQHALHFLAQLRTRTNLARNDDDLLEHLDAAGNVAARHPLTLGGWAARAIRMGFDTYLRRRLRLPTVAGGHRIRCRCRTAQAQNARAEKAGTDVGQQGHERHAMTCPLGPTARVPHDGAVMSLWRALRQLDLPASWEAANITMDVRHATRRCDVLVHLANTSYVIDVTRVHRADEPPGRRRGLLRGAEDGKHRSYPPLFHGRELVPIVINDLGGMGDEGLAALRKIAANVSRLSGTRMAEAFDLVLASVLQGYHEAAHRHAVRVGIEHSGPAGHDADAPADDEGASPPPPHHRRGGRRGGPKRRKRKNRRAVARRILPPAVGAPPAPLPPTDPHTPSSPTPANDERPPSSPATAPPSLSSSPPPPALSGAQVLGASGRTSSKNSDLVPYSGAQKQT